jgi:hypothetical protein
MPVIALDVAQVQPLGQVVRVLGIDAKGQEPRHASREDAACRFVPRFGVHCRGLGWRELVGSMARQQLQEFGLRQPQRRAHVVSQPRSGPDQQALTIRGHGHASVGESGE